MLDCLFVYSTIEEFQMNRGTSQILNYVTCWDLWNLADASVLEVWKSGNICFQNDVKVPKLQFNPQMYQPSLTKHSITP